jgi:hypothetical protein
VAIIKFSGLVSEIRGKLDNVIVQGWKSGVFVVKKMMTSVNNPNSTRQDVMRSAVSEFAKKWLDTLTPAERADWETYAKTAPGYYAVPAGVRELVGSNGGVMSGQNAYVMTNCWLINTGMVAVTTPPLGKTPPGKPENVAASCAAGTLTVTWTPPASKEADAYARVWIASVSNTFHKQKCKIEDVTVGTVDITTIRGAKGLDVLLAAMIGETVLIQMDTVNPSGGKSGGSNTYEVKIA